MKKSSFSAAVAAVLAAFGLLFYSAQVAEGVRAGLTSCAKLLIPSLFPFMILAALVEHSRAGQAISRLVSLVLTPLTGLPQTLGAVYFMSMMGGFPVGARMLAQMLERRELDAQTASRALCCTVNAGPSFLIAAVGTGMFGSLSAGLTLLAAQILSSLCLMTAEFHKDRNIHASFAAHQKTTSGAFVESVRSSASGMFGICAFVIAFSAISALLRACGFLPFLAKFCASLFPQLGEAFFIALFSGVLEVTSGSVSAAALHSREGFVLCAFLVSFSSLSILSQVQSCFHHDSGMNFSRLYSSRLTGGLLSSLFALLGWQWIPQLATATLSSSSAPIASVKPEMFVTGGCLIAMFTILLLCPPLKQQSKKKIVNIFE